MTPAPLMTAPRMTTGTPVRRGLAEHRSDILQESLLVLLNFVVAVWLVNRKIPAYWGLDTALSLTIAFVILQAGIIALLLVATFTMKLRDEWRAKEGREKTGAAVALATAIARGEQPAEAWRELRLQAPRVADRVLVDAMSAQRGEGRRLLAEAARASGALQAWRAATESPTAERRCEGVLRLAAMPPELVREDLRTALEDPEELVAVEAARALLAGGSGEEAEVVFASLPHQTLMVQALMLSALRKYAGTLAAEAIPEALASADDRIVLAALGALRTWKRMVPVPGILTAVQHATPEVRLAALAALPYVLLPEAPLEALRVALRDPLESVRAAAAYAAGRLNLTELIPELTENARRGGESGRGAAAALCRLGQRGVEAAEEIVRLSAGGEREAAEALERHRLGRGGA